MKYAIAQVANGWVIIYMEQNGDLMMLGPNDETPCFASEEEAVAHLQSIGVTEEV